jgi:hypothetical protein
MGSHLANIDPGSLSEEDKAAIREQLARILGSPFFQHSKRFPAILRFVVEQTLAGRTDEIKERTLGVELFARKPDYEAATDPIVRVAAAEIRKRLAQYYMEPRHAHELRINVLPGSYIPTFDWSGEAAEVHSEPESAVGLPQSTEREPKKSRSVARIVTVAPQSNLPEHRDHEPQSTEPVKGIEVSAVPEKGDSRHGVWRAAIITLAAAVILAAVSAFVMHVISPSPIDFFWNPIQQNSETVLICIADQIQDSGIGLRDTVDPSHLRWLDDPQKKNPFTTIALDNVEVVAKVVEILHSRHLQYALKSEAATNLDGLRSGPDVFIGGFDNAWTLRMTNSLRFRFANDPDMEFPRIVDAQNPKRTAWKIDPPSVGTNGTYRDYGVVARFEDENTGKPVVVIAGIGRCGSLAAGQFVSSSEDLAPLERAALAAGNKKNLEVVLSTQVINGFPGSPKIEAVNFW